MLDANSEVCMSARENVIYYTQKDCDTYVEFMEIMKISPVNQIMANNINMLAPEIMHYLSTNCAMMSDVHD